MLLLVYPNLKSASGPVLDRLIANGADAAALGEWKRTVSIEIVADEYEG